MGFYGLMEGKGRKVRTCGGKGRNKKQGRGEQRG